MYDISYISWPVWAPIISTSHLFIDAKMRYQEMSFLLAFVCIVGACISVYVPRQEQLMSTLMRLCGRYRWQLPCRWHTSLPGVSALCFPDPQVLLLHASVKHIVIQRSHRHISLCTFFSCGNEIKNWKKCTGSLDHWITEKWVIMNQQRSIWLVSWFWDGP